jgi:hypothetical protein
MAIRTNTNARPLELTPELQDILARNGMQAQVMAGSNGFALMVQGHDSPRLQYAISEAQLKALTDWGTNTANKKAYNTFASIVAADFDMPKDFVHARNANGRVAMGLHGYRVGAGEYNRQPHMMGRSFLGWTPRQQEGFHLRRIGSQLYTPGAPMVAQRSDGRMKPGELQSGGYGFYYKGYTTAPVAQNTQDVLANLQTVVQPLHQPVARNTTAVPYKQAITSEVYFSNEKWQEVLASHGLIVDAEHKSLTVQSASVEADLKYDLTEAEVKTLTSNSLKEASVAKRLEVINSVIGEDFSEKVTMEMLNTDKPIDIQLHPEVLEDLNRQLETQEQYEKQQTMQEQVAPEQGLREGLPKGGVVMNGNDLTAMNPEKGWFREGRHGREVTVDDIRVEPIQNPDKAGDVKYRMTAVIDGERVSHDISKREYDKFMAVDDLHRMKLFSKVFSEVDMKNRYPVGFGTKLTAALLAGATVTHEVMHGLHHAPEVYAEGHRGGHHEPSVYFKPGVDSPADVAARRFDAMVNNPHGPHGPGIGM